MKSLKLPINSNEICPNCEIEHDNNEWNGYCSKICWWGFPSKIE